MLYTQAPPAINLKHVVEVECDVLLVRQASVGAGCGEEAGSAALGSMTGAARGMCPYIVKRPSGLGRPQVQVSG